MNKTIPIYVINLDRCPDRREKMSRRLDELGLEYKFFAGVDGALLSEKRIAEVYKPMAAFVRLGRELHPNEIACAWSHIKLYEMMIAEGIEEMVILEDDIDLHDGFPLLLAARRDWLPPDWRLLNFAHLMSEPIPMKEINVLGLANHWICSFDRVVGGTGAYMIQRKGAEALLNQAYPIRKPADDLAGDSGFLGSKVYGVIPRVAVWDDNFASSIWTDTTRESFAEASRSGFIGILRRLLRRARNFFK